MTSLVRHAALVALLASGLAGLAACAAQQKTAPSAEASYAAGSAQQAPGAYPQGSPPSASPPPPPVAQPGMAPQPSGGTPAQQRAFALQSAANEVESSQRELDVAAGDCRNACRALGSMDRAAGRLCGLTQGDPETRRCDDAKQRVYSARDRVKATCGQCEGGPSVDRSAPIPSLR